MWSAIVDWFMKWPELSAALVGGVVAGVVAALVASWQVRAARRHEVDRGRRDAFAELLVRVARMESAVDEGHEAYKKAVLGLIEGMTRWQIFADTKEQRRVTENVNVILSSLVSEAEKVAAEPPHGGTLPSLQLGMLGQRFRELREGLFNRGTDWHTPVGRADRRAARKWLEEQGDRTKPRLSESGVNAGSID